jgi:hypothetical protein
METTKLTVRLPRAEVEFVKEYARKHGVTVTALIDRYFSRLQMTAPNSIHPEVARLAGLVPERIDARKIYQEHLEGKHR